MSLVFRNNCSSQSVSSQPSIRVSASERYIFSRKAELNCNYSLESSICRTKHALCILHNPCHIKPRLSKIMCLHKFEKQFILHYPNSTSTSTPPLPQPNLNLNLLVRGELLCLGSFSISLYLSLPIMQVSHLLLNKHNKVNIDLNIANMKD